MAFPFPPKSLIFISLFVFLVSFVLSSPTHNIQSPNVISIPQMLQHKNEASDTMKIGRQERTIMEMMKDNGVNMGDMFNWSNLFKLNGTQFSWVPLGSLLFSNNGNIFGAGR